MKDISKYFENEELGIWVEPKINNVPYGIEFSVCKPKVIRGYCLKIKLKAKLYKLLKFIRRDKC